MSEHPEFCTDVFVVEEARVIAHTLSVILRQAGYNVRVFLDAAAAAASLYVRPRLIISDPHMSGPVECELARSAATNTTETKLLFLSSGVDLFDSSWLKVSDCLRETKFLEKPLYPSQLLQCVEEMIGRPATDIG